MRIIILLLMIKKEEFFLLALQTDGQTHTFLKSSYTAYNSLEHSVVA